jgi:predicted benzoate:H+ symporter BenE
MNPESDVIHRRALSVREVTGSVMRPVLAGVVTALLVGFGGAFPVVLAGLRAVGADERQAASGLLAVCLASGAVAVVLGLRTRMPLSIAWSTPGAALLIALPRCARSTLREALC